MRPFFNRIAFGTQASVASGEALAGWKQARMPPADFAAPPAAKMSATIYLTSTYTGLSTFAVYALRETAKFVQEYAGK